MDIIREHGVGGSGLKSADKASLIALANQADLNSSAILADLISKLGSPTVTGNTWSKVVNDIFLQKTNLVSRLSDIGISATNTEALKSLIDKIIVSNLLSLTPSILAYGNTVNGVVGTLKSFSAGNIDLISNTIGVQNASYTPAAVKKFKVNATGIYRVLFRMQNNNTSANVGGRIYKNGVPYGTSRTATNVYQDFTEDLLFNANDSVELWLWAIDTNSYAYSEIFKLSVAEMAIKTL